MVRAPWAAGEVLVARAPARAPRELTGVVAHAASATVVREEVASALVVRGEMTRVVRGWKSVDRRLWSSGPWRVHRRLVGVEERAWPDGSVQARPVWSAPRAWIAVAERVSLGHQGPRSPHRYVWYPTSTYARIQQKQDRGGPCCCESSRVLGASRTNRNRVDRHGRRMKADASQVST